MDLLTDLIRLLLVMVCLTAFVGIALWVLFALSDADETINEGVRMVTEARKDRPPYDHEAEGDFPAWPREDHSPLAYIGHETVAVWCTCGYRHVEPIYTTAQSAYRACVDEFWSVHMQEVAA